ncbi:AraC-type DNA-binding protein [Halopseudomonas sabulinigri]|uniref:AraC-type DNA-binding protein n=1 Tax=Halopseudomonas sabulinigri TaxID=472181 RepID=A0A1H1MAL5_9GAMM|nr:AraC family transcriptional regulator [Halopseudomonas sabulinigri]SDR83019.1 AraC-type DNA-binding protein [Halopseudomonas sabulinigri]
MSTAVWLDSEARFIAARGQPACLIDLALSRGIDSHRLLKGTGLFYEDLLEHDPLITARQFHRLIDNARQLLAADDSAFLFGQQLLPGHYGATSNLLLQADTVLQALQQLQRFKALLSPLCAPVIRIDEQSLYLYWLDSFDSGKNRQFMVDASMTAVTALCRQVCGHALPWQYHLMQAEPVYVEQYWVHLGEHLHFNSPTSFMRLPREHLITRAGQASAVLGRIAEQQSLQQLSALTAPQSLTDGLFDYLCEHISGLAGLEQVAADFAMSAATFKRRLQREGTHFQAQLDRARTLIATDLYLRRGFSNEAVASYLHFNDRTNFRRFLKRLTGRSPNDLRQFLGH